MSAIEDKYYTLEEYFDLVEELDFKIEYHRGRIVALAGGTSNHSIIGTNIRRRLSEKLDDTDCVVYDSEMQLAVESESRYVYPDAMVVCGDREFTDESKKRIKNPVLIVEVLSKKSTEGYDKMEKFRYYRNIPSFREYVLIDPEEPAIDIYYKEEVDLWRISTSTGLESTINLFSLDIELRLADIYAKTEDLKGP
jgi:Uma2 family endonuclease